MRFSYVFTQNYQILKMFSIDPKLLNSEKDFNPKVSDGHPRMYTARETPGLQREGQPKIIKPTKQKYSGKPLIIVPKLRLIAILPKLSGG